MVATMKHLLATLLLLIAIGSADAQTFGSSTIETSATALTVSGSTFTPPCPTLGGPSSGVYNVVATAAGQTIALPTSCPSQSVGLFTTFNLCNGKGGGSAPCNGTASGPFSPGLAFGVGYEFPFSPGPYTATATGGAKDIVTCEVLGTTGPWSCGVPQYALTPINNTPALGASAHTGSQSSSPFTVTLTTQGSSGVLVLFVLTNNSSATAPTITSTSPVSLTWSQRVSQASSLTGNDLLTEYTAPFSQLLSSEVINVTLAGMTFGTADVFEVKNAPASSYFDPNGALPNGVTGAGNPSITTSNANDIIYCAFRSANPNIAAGSGWTLISGADFQEVQYKNVSVTQAATSCTYGDNAVNAGIGDAIQ